MQILSIAVPSTGLFPHVLEHLRIYFPVVANARAAHARLQHRDLAVFIHAPREFVTSNDPLENPGPTRAQRLRPPRRLPVRGQVLQTSRQRPKDCADFDLVSALKAVRL